MTDANQETTSDRDTMWRLNCLAQPTFTDITHGVFLGLVWSVALWTPMFVSVLF